MRAKPLSLDFFLVVLLFFRGTMVAFIESIQVETLRAQNTGKIGPGDDNGSSSNLATLAGPVVFLFPKNLPENIRSKKNYYLTTN